MRSTMRPRHFRIRTKWFSIDAWGIEFRHKGDAILWLYPWRREYPDCPFYSMCFCDYFKSLEALDLEWDSYAEAMQQ